MCPTFLAPSSCERVKLRCSDQNFLSSMARTRHGEAEYSTGERVQCVLTRAHKRGAERGAAPRSNAQGLEWRCKKWCRSPSKKLFTKLNPSIKAVCVPACFVKSC